MTVELLNVELSNVKYYILKDTVHLQNTTTLKSFTQSYGSLLDLGLECMTI